jgi:uncharacterized protein
MTELIVDGYNVLHAVPRYRQVLTVDLGSARDRLINELAGLVADDSRVTVVFDGGGNPEADGVAREQGGVWVVFSPSGVEADTIVEGMAREAARGDRDVLVVTSDAATAKAVSGGVVRVMSAVAFGDELHEQGRERGDDSHGRRTRSTVEDRLSLEARATLLRMRHRRT